MILKLANEEQKKHILENARGLDYQMYSSAFSGWVKIQGLYSNPAFSEREKNRRFQIAVLHFQ